MTGNINTKNYLIFLILLLFIAEEEENPSAIRLKRRGEEGSALSNKFESADPPSEVK